MAPELTAVLDASAMRRAVDNLLANAIEYADVRAVRGRCRRCGCPRPTASSLHTLTIAVEDTGPGFPADFLPHAFDRFRRADPARTHSHGQRGAGLGLAVVREIAEAHGGSVEARNLAAGGACVSISIPQPRTAAAARRACKQQSCRPSPSSSPTPYRPGRNGFNPYGIAALGVGVIVLIILLITFRKR